MKFRVAVVPVVALLTFLFSSPASALSSISPTTADKGATSVFSVRIANDASTMLTGVDIKLPSDQSLTTVNVEPHAGWAYEFVRDSGRVTSVRWTATANGSLKTGEFDQFNLLLGPLPTDSDALTVNVRETYEDGTNKSSSLTVGLNPDGVSVASSLGQATLTETTNANSDRSDAALAIGIVALVIAVTAFLLNLVAAMRRPD